MIKSNNSITHENNATTVKDQLQEIQNTTANNNNDNMITHDVSHDSINNPFATYTSHGQTHSYMSFINISRQKHPLLSLVTQDNETPTAQADECRISNKYLSTHSTHSTSFHV